MVKRGIKLIVLMVLAMPAGMTVTGAYAENPLLLDCHGEIFEQDAEPDRDTNSILAAEGCRGEGVPTATASPSPTFTLPPTLGPLPSPTPGPLPAIPPVPSSDSPSGYFSQWVNSGPLKDPNFFPIGVWLQNPCRSAPDGRSVGVNYRDMGINIFIGYDRFSPEYDGCYPTGSYVVAHQSDASNPYAQGSPKVVGYLVTDEPDMNLHPEYGGCMLPPDLKRLTDPTRTADPTRPTYVNFGKGFALPDFYHGANCPSPGASRDRWRTDPASRKANRDFLPDQNHQPYYDWAAIPDITSADFYPMNDVWEPDYNRTVDSIGRMVRRTRFYAEASHPDKPVWAFIETTDINRKDDGRKPTLAEVTAQVQQAWDNGADGIIYFAHCFNPFVEPCLLEDRAMVDHLTRLNTQMQAGLRPIG